MLFLGKGYKVPDKIPDNAKTASIGVSVVVPAYNEEGNIAKLVELFAEIKSSTPWMRLEVVFVDDGSTDGTYLRMVEAREIHDFISIIRFRKNQGLTVALLEGFKRTSHEILAFYPADLQYLPEDLPALIEPLRNDPNIEIVCGKRIGDYDKPLVSYIYNKISRWMFDVKVSDSNSIKAFRGYLNEELFLRSSLHRYIIAIASYKGYKIVEIPVRLHPRYWGKSNFSSPLRMVSGVLDLVSIKFELVFINRPMVFFGGLGVLLVFLGVTFGLSYYPLKWGNLITPDAKLIFLLSAWGATITGFLLFSMGVLSDFFLRLHGKNNLFTGPVEYYPARLITQNNKEQSD